MSAHPAMVLIVDDDAGVSRALARVVRSMGFAVATFETGEALLGGWVSGGPAVLLLDLHLPGLSGAELISVLCTRDPEIRIIVMTGRDVDDAREACLLAGATAFIRKPVARSLLEDLLSV